jgi:S-adenosyl-L-methionine hydrolase (adenosine-forming)
MQVNAAGYGWISLTTDYGRSDGFAATLHGVIARIAPHVRVIDVTHDVPPGDIVRGATVLAQTITSLPPSVHVVVVDPGVGTRRRAVAIDTGDGILVGPDNGVLLAAADALGGIVEAVELTKPDWHGQTVSATFHGRDIFAPVAARLAHGAPLHDAGLLVAPTDLVRLPPPVVTYGDRYLEAQVLTIDRFGNVQLAAPASDLGRLGESIAVGRLRAVRATTFGDAPAGTMMVFADSAGYLAVAINGGRAASALGIEPGDVLRLATL